MSLNNPEQVEIYDDNLSDNSVDKYEDELAEINEEDIDNDPEVEFADLLINSQPNIQNVIHNHQINCNIQAMLHNHINTEHDDIEQTYSDCNTEYDDAEQTDSIQSEINQIKEEQIKEQDNIEQDNIQIETEKCMANHDINVPDSTQRKRRIPKAMLEKQEIYNKTLEKQKKMTTNKKDNKKDKNATVKVPVAKLPTSNTAGMRRVIIGGQVRYIPMPVTVPILEKKGSLPEQILQNNTSTSLAESPLPIPDAPVKKLSSIMAKKMEIYNANLEKTQKMSKNNRTNTNGKTNTTRRLPNKYAKHIENDVKKQTVKNVKTFSDLRRVKALQNITADSGSDIDIGKASINELKKIRLEQRKKEQLETKKVSEANKKESAIQEILKNDKMSKFSKLVAIKNLSVNSRHKK